MTGGEGLESSEAPGSGSRRESARDPGVPPPVRPSVQQPPGDLVARLYRALGPLAGALVLDFADFATLGPFGLWLGFPLGASIGWWLSGMYRLPPAARAFLAVLAGAYCMVPATNLLPVATVLSATGRFLENPRDAELVGPEEGVPGTDRED